MKSGIWLREAFFTLICLISGIAIAGTTPQPSPSPIAHRILFIGNSLTQQNEIHRMLCRLADATKKKMYCQAVTLPGFSLSDHWIDGRAARGIAVGSWTEVVLQQGPSGTTGRLELLEYASRYSRLIRQVGARPALYMVWPSQQRSLILIASAGPTVPRH